MAGKILALSMRGSAYMGRAEYDKDRYFDTLNLEYCPPAVTVG